MALVLGADFIVGDIFVDGEKMMGVINSYDGSIMEREDLLKLQKDITRLLEVVSVETMDKFNAKQKKDTHEEWIRMNEGLNEFGEKEKVVKPKRSNGGYVYIIKEHFSDTHKIGMTTRLKDRQATFGVTLPFEWDFIFIYKSNDHELLEKKLHEKFAGVRTGGEWFQLSDADIEFLDTNIHLDEEFSSMITEVVECPKKE